MPKRQSGNKKGKQSNFAKLSIFQPNKYKFKKTCPLSVKGAPEVDYKNIKGSYIHFKIKGDGKLIEELEKNEAIDKKLLRNLTVKVKKFDLDTNYFSKKDDIEKTEKKEKIKN